MRIRPSRGALAPLLVLLALAGGCAGGPAPRGGPAPGEGPACWDLRYRIRVSDGERERGGRLVVRACRDGRLLAEVRGRVGAPVLVAAVRDGRVRLLLPRRREAVDGPDEAAFWRRWAGIPLPGAALLERRPGRRGGRRPLRAAGWRGEVTWNPLADDPCPFPARLVARDEEGAFLLAERVRARTAAGAPAWPEVPAGFTRREDAPGGGRGAR